MAGSTPNLGLYLPGGGSTGTIVPDETADIDPLNENFQKIDTAVGDVSEQNRQWYGPAASIGSLPVDPKDGDLYQESDGNKILWKRLGGLWVTNENGMYLIRPTSVVGGTVAADGSVTPTDAGASVSFNGVFSSRFKIYKVYYFFRTTAATSGYFRFRRAGTDIVLGYGNQRMYAAGGAPGGSQVIGTFFDMGASSALFHSGEIVLMNMTESTDNNPKTWLGSDAKGVPTAFCSYGGFNGDATAVAPLDGFSIFAGASTYSGLAENMFKIYGLA